VTHSPTTRILTELKVDFTLILRNITVWNYHYGQGQGKIQQLLDKHFNKENTNLYVKTYYDPDIAIKAPNNNPGRRLSIDNVLKLSITINYLVDQELNRGNAPSLISHLSDSFVKSVGTGEFQSSFRNFSQLFRDVIVNDTTDFSIYHLRIVRSMHPTSLPTSIPTKAPLPTTSSAATVVFGFLWLGAMTLLLFGQLGQLWRWQQRKKVNATQTTLSLELAWKQFIEVYYYYL